MNISVEVSESTEIVSDRESTQLRNKTAMILFALEQSLGKYVRENVRDPSELPIDQVKPSPNRVTGTPPVIDIIALTYIAEILDLAISVAKYSTDKDHLLHIKRLTDALKLYDVRNAVCHPNRPFPECFWFRVSALATDPAIEYIQFHDVRRAFESAKRNKIDLPDEEWYSIPTFSITNNLPNNTEHAITGLIGRGKEKAEFIKFAFRTFTRRVQRDSSGGPGVY